MFNISKLQDSFNWKIEVEMPHNGKFEKIPVNVRYYRLPHNEKMQLLKQLSTGEQLGSEQELLDKVFAGWEKGQIKTDDGDLEDNIENREKLLNITEFRLAVIKGFATSMGGDVGKMKG